MWRSCVTLIVALGVWTVPLAAHADLSPEQVRNSIDRAVNYLKREQTERGTWPDHPAFAGGITPA